MSDKTLVEFHFKAIMAAVQTALDDDVRVFIGGDPVVLQVTRGPVSRTFRLVSAGDHARVPAVVPAAEGNGRAFTGDVCHNCGNAKMIRTGTCLTCTVCGDTSSCG